MRIALLLFSFHFSAIALQNQAAGAVFLCKSQSFARDAEFSRKNLKILPF